MGIYTYRKNLTGTLNLATGYFTSLTFVGLGTSLEGQAIPPLSGNPPIVIIEGESGVDLEARNITTLGFDVYKNPVGIGPPYNNVQIVVIVGAGVQASVTPGGLVSDFLDDIVHRIGRLAFADYGEPFILRRMNDTYKRLNQENQCCRKEFAADWSQYTAATLKDYVAAPSDWIKPYNMNPYRAFRLPSVWRNDELNTYTIDFVDDQKRIYLANASLTSLINFSYYSMGLTLVNSISPASTETNKPEWPDELKQLLYFETVLALRVELDPYELSERNKLIARMSSLRVSQFLQATGPNIGGELAHGGRLSTITDPYSRTS